MYHYVNKDKNKDMYIFTDEEKRQAKEVSTLDYLERNYGYHFKKVGSMYKGVEHDSLIVRPDCKGWYWNSRGFGGADVIEFIRKVEHKSYDEALIAILGTSSASEISSKPLYDTASKVTEPEHKHLELPPRLSGQFKRVFAYLTKTRLIEPLIVTTLMHKNYIYEDLRHNCVFVGYGHKGLASYAAIRTTLTEAKYRKEAVGSDKDVGFYLKGYNKSRLNVFESPIDLLSHATLCNLSAGSSRAWLDETRLSLGGVSDRALEGYLKHNSEVEEIVLRLDNDPAGRVACEKMKEKYTAQGYKVTVALPKNKDYNDDLKELVNAPKKA